MHAAITTVAFRGIETIPVEVQVHIANGLPAMAIVGLADKAVFIACCVWRAPFQILPGVNR